MESSSSTWTGAIATRSDPWWASWAIFTLVVAALVPGCAEDPGDALLVSAATSLTDVLAVIEQGFESEYPGVDVVLNLGATSTVSRQLLERAPVDVFASADLDHMDLVAEAGLVAGEPSVFATNRLQIAVGEGNPTSVTGLADLEEEGRAVGLCASAVPCGRLAREALDAARVTPSLDSEEPNVRALLTKIALGELDVGVVYQTEVAADSRVEGIEIPGEVNVVNEYAIAALSASDRLDTARQFVAYVLSPAGRAILEAAGFGVP
jgi:molybdate transport system substrate-binding protein